MNINTTNYEEYFLLYIDNELSAEQKTAVENFIEANPSYQKEFELLKQTGLAPEPFEFEDKILLYRLEEMEASLTTTFKQSLYRNETKVVEGYFNTNLIRSIAAVAAIVILIVGYNLIPTTGKQNNETLLAKNVLLPINKTENNIGVSTNQDQKLVAQNEIHTIAQNSTKPTSTIPSIAAEKTDITPQVGMIQSITNSTGRLANYENEIHTAPIVNNSVAITSLNEKITSNETSVVSEAKEEFENINTDNPDRTIYIANMEIDGDKLRGFTRRIGALIKRNKTEKEK
jgi:hypothetical protein